MSQKPTCTNCMNRAGCLRIKLHPGFDFVALAGCNKYSPKAKEPVNESIPEEKEIIVDSTVKIQNKPTKKMKNKKKKE